MTARPTYGREKVRQAAPGAPTGGDGRENHRWAATGAPIRVRSTQVVRTVQALMPGAPYTWVNAVDAPSTWRVPAPPRSWSTLS